MKLSNKTIQEVGKIITGDGKISPYRSGQKLVSFFTEYGCEKRYGPGFPSRWAFTEDELHRINDTESMKLAVIEAVHPKYYEDTEFSVGDVVSNLNNCLKYDGFELIKNGLTYQVIKKDFSTLAQNTFSEKLDVRKGDHLFIVEQNTKCKEKLEKSDYDGAITNARSMVEAVFEAIIKKFNNEVPVTDGDLNKLYKVVKKLLHLDANADLNDTLKQIVSGLNSIVTGLAGIGNKMGDRHPRKYKPEKHHALLAVNSAYTLCEFLLSSLEYQQKKPKKEEVIV